MIIIGGKDGSVNFEGEGNIVNFDFDCFVIGAGSGGVRAAKLAAAQGKKLVLRRNLDTVAPVLLGCVPKKLMLFASDFRQKFEDSYGFGWSENALKLIG